MDLPLQEMLDTTVGWKVHDHGVLGFWGNFACEILAIQGTNHCDSYAAGHQNLKKAVRKNHERKWQGVSSCMTMLLYTSHKNQLLP
jgi:hypothetical protein